MQEPAEQSLEPPKKKAKALAGLTEAAEQSSDEDADLLLPVDEQMEEEDEKSVEAETMVPRVPKANGKVSCLTSFWHKMQEVDLMHQRQQLAFRLSVPSSRVESYPLSRSDLTRSFFCDEDEWTSYVKKKTLLTSIHGTDLCWLPSPRLQGSNKGQAKQTGCSCRQVNYPRCKQNRRGQNIRRYRFQTQMQVLEALLTVI